MKEKIQEIAYLLFKRYPEIIDPTVLKNSELDDLLKELELNIELNEEEKMLIKVKWANLVFNLSSSPL